MTVHMDKQTCKPRERWLRGRPFPCCETVPPCQCFGIPRSHNWDRSCQAYSIMLPPSCCQPTLRYIHCAYQMTNSLTKLIKYVLKTWEKQASCSHLTAFTVKPNCIQIKVYYDKARPSLWKYELLHCDDILSTVTMKGYSFINCSFLTDSLEDTNNFIGQHTDDQCNIMKTPSIPPDWNISWARPQPEVAIHSPLTLWGAAVHLACVFNPPLGEQCNDQLYLPWTSHLATFTT